MWACQQTDRLPWANMESFTHSRATCAQYGTRVAWYSYVPASVPESSCSKGTSLSPGGVRKMHPSPSCFSVVHRRLIMWLSWRWLLPKASVLKTRCSKLRPLVCAGTGHPSSPSAPSVRTWAFILPKTNVSVSGGLPQFSEQTPLKFS